MTTKGPDTEATSVDDGHRHRDLISAYRRLEAYLIQLEHDLSRGRRWLWISIAILVLVLTALDLVYWLWVDRELADDHRRTTEASPASQTTKNQFEVADFFTVTRQNASQHLSLLGKVAPGSIVNVPAPFAGTVVSLNFTYGARVLKGESLLRLDTAELESKQRTAQIAQIQAQEELKQLLDWSASSEVAGARRSLEAAKQHLGKARSQARASEGLYREGIISREELDSAGSQLADSERAAKAAEESLQATLRKGSEENVRVARLKRQNADYDLEQIQSELAMADVRSPLSGVALLPQEGSQEASKTIVLGTQVDAGQVLLAVGDMDNLLIHAMVSELDINNIVPDLEVQVRGDALGKTTLEGQVAAVGSQALETRGRTLTSYPITVDLRLPSDIVRQRIRLGMHMELKATVYDNPDAIVIPETAVQGKAGGYWVYRFDADNNQLVSTPVDIGRPLIDGIEITKGLSPGDRIKR